MEASTKLQKGTFAKSLLLLISAGTATNTYFFMVAIKIAANLSCRILIMAYYFNSQNYWNTARTQNAFAQMDPKKPDQNAAQEPVARKLIQQRVLLPSFSIFSAKLQRLSLK